MLRYQTSIKWLRINRKAIWSHRSKSWIYSLLAIKGLFEFSWACFVEDCVILMSLRAQLISFCILIVNGSDWCKVDVVLVFYILVLSILNSCAWWLHSEDAFKSKFLGQSCWVITILFELSLEFFWQDLWVNKLIKGVMIEVELSRFKTFLFSRGSQKSWTLWRNARLVVGASEPLILLINNFL